MSTEKLILGKVPALFSPFHLFIVGCTLVVYNVHYLIKKSTPELSDQYAWVQKNQRFNYFFLLAGVLLCALFVWQLPKPVIVACIVLSVISFSYSLPVLPFRNKHRLKDFGWLKLLLLTIVWTTVTAVLPILFWGFDPLAFPFEILVRFVFLLILCLAFDIRDHQVDLESGIVTLPNKIGVSNTYMLINVLTCVFVLAGIFQFCRFGTLFRLFDIIFVSFTTMISIYYVKKFPSDKNYIFLVDGQMILLGLLTIFF
jgi:4-hydroxybenzoate polyprenyltransferase